MRKIASVVAGLVCLFALTGNVDANPVWVGPGKITQVANGWGGEGMLFTFSVAMSGSTCTSQGPNGYGISINHGTYSDIVTQMWIAYVKGYSVNLVVDSTTCAVGGTPYVYAIYLLPH